MTTPYREVRAAVMAAVNENSLALKTAIAELHEQISAELKAKQIDGKYLRVADVHAMRFPQRLLALTNEHLAALPDRMAAAVPDDAEDAESLRVYVADLGRKLANRSLRTLQLTIAAGAEWN